MTTDRSSPALRIGALTAIVAVLLLMLGSRLWYLQVLAGDRYTALSERNAVQIVYSQAPRGRILAADGSAIVRNRVALAISADRKRLLDEAGQPRDEEAEAVLDRLSQVLDAPVGDIVERLTDPTYSPFRPVPIAVDVPPEIVLAVQEHQELFPGVIAERLPVRAYPEGTLAAHVVGYTAEISAEQMEQEAFRNYQLGDLVGQAGLEQSYERHLNGQRGRRVLEVNAQGIVLRELRETEPVPGNDLVTSIDLDLQRVAERILTEQITRIRGTTDSEGRTLPAPSGSAVVLDVDTGEVLAMASHPTYDPAEFVGGVSPEYFNDVFRDVIVRERKNDEPEVVEDPDPEPKAGVNRVVSETWAPGSVFKPIAAAGFLEGGVISTTSRLECPGYWRQGPHAALKHNWHRGHEGSMDITTALKRSCDTFFYEVADRQWREVRDRRGADRPMQEMARRLGFDEPLGIDLPEEAGGIIPDPQWKRHYWEANKDWQCEAKDNPRQSDLQRAVAEEFCEDGHVWVGGDPVNASIGQGFVTATPLQVVSAYAALANGGRLLRPHVGVAVRSPDGETVETIEPEVLRQVRLSGSTLRAVRAGMEQAVMGDRGTAAGAFAGFPLQRIPVAGKTGTAEWKQGEPAHSWFGAYAPADDPEVAVVVMIEQGGGGSAHAAPVVRRILEAHFGLPVTPFS